jgi:hypothetical protein
MSDFDVTYYQVLAPHLFPERQQEAHVAVGPMFETPEQGRELLNRIRPDHPRAYLVRAISFESDSDGRDDMLRQIVPADEWGAEAFGLL